MAYRLVVRQDRDIRTLTTPMMTTSQPASGLALLFQPQARPSARDVAALLARDPAAARVMSISHQPKDEDDWIEVLCRGLTFDVTGLAPSVAAPVPAIDHFFGFDEPQADPALAPVLICAGQHLSGGEGLLPLVRAQLEVGLALMALPGVWGAVWRPASVAINPALFNRVVTAWLGGGPFPALGLTALVQEPDGGLRSTGLAFFAGQDLRIDPMPDANPSRLGKIAIRLIHRLVEGGAIRTPTELTGPDGEALMAEPVDQGRVLRICSRDQT